MHASVSVRTIASRQAVDDRLRMLTAGGAFRVRDLASVGVNAWRFRLQPMRPDMAVGFGKAAELLVLLARDFEVQAVELSCSREVAAAS